MRIARAVLAEHGCLRAAIWHRTGVVEVGEASVGIAISSAHRGRRVRRLQAGHRHAQGDGADLEEGALRRRRGLDRPGRLSRPSRYREVVSSNTPEPGRSSPSRARRPSRRATTSGRSIRRARCACGRKRIGGPLIAVVGARVPVDPQAQVRDLRGRQVQLRHDRGDDGRLGRGLRAAVGLAASPRSSSCCCSSTSSATRCGMRKEGIPAGAPGLHPVPGRRDLDEGHAAQRLRRGQGRPRGPGARHARRGRRARARRAPGLRPAACRGAHRLPAQPLQPAADRAARRRARDGRDPSRRSGSPASSASAALLVFSPNAILILILMLGGREAWVRWRSRKDEADATYYTVAASRRVLIAPSTSASRSLRARHARGLRRHVDRPAELPTRRRRGDGGGLGRRRLRPSSCRPGRRARVGRGGRPRCRRRPARRRRAGRCRRRAASSWRAWREPVLEVDAGRRARVAGIEARRASGRRAACRPCRRGRSRPPRCSARRKRVLMQHLAVGAAHRARDRDREALLAVASSARSSPAGTSGLA